MTEEVRATDASLSTCVRKGKRAIATGDVRGSASRPDRGVGHAAARASTGTRRTVHGEKVACGYQARAPENGAATRTERLLRSSDPKGGGEFTCRFVSEMDVDALRFTEATRDALSRAERARVANATAFHPDAAKKG